MRCPECEEMLFRKVVEEALHVCPGCQYHFRISARTRVEQLVDPGSFEERFADVEPTDPLRFTDKKAYRDRLKAEQEKTGNPDAVVCGKAFIKGRPLVLAVMDPTFMMGSMGSVVGEKITRTIEAAVAEKLPLLVGSCVIGNLSAASRVAGAYDAIVVAVAHDEFRALGVDGLRRLANGRAVVYDIKGIFPKDAVDARL